MYASEPTLDSSPGRTVVRLEDTLCLREPKLAGGRPSGGARGRATFGVPRGSALQVTEGEVRGRRRQRVDCGTTATWAV